jgi:hypothetical protein
MSGRLRFCDVPNRTKRRKHVFIITSKNVRALHREKKNQSLLQIIRGDTFSFSHNRLIYLLIWIIIIGIYTKYSCVLQLGEKN